MTIWSSLNPLRFSVPACSNCGVAVLPWPHCASLSTARKVCRRCSTAAIEHIAQAQPYFRRALHWFMQEKFSFENVDLKVEFRNRAQMNEMAQSTKALGVTVRAQGHCPSERILCVAILRGLPPALLQHIIVHELGHVWLGVHCADRLELWEEEGVCELLSYLYLCGCPEKEARFQSETIAASSDPVYGLGFKRVSTLAEREPNLFHILQTKKQLPRRRLQQPHSAIMGRSMRNIITKGNCA